MEQMKQNGLSYVNLKDMTEDLQALKNLYVLSFPREERKPFEMIEEGNRNGGMEAFGVYEGRQLVGLAFSIFGKDKILLDYLAVDPAFQNRQIGSRILEDLKNWYRKPLIVEVESTLRNPSAIKDKRKNFYLRNGFIANEYEISLFGVPMEVLSTQPASYCEYAGILENYFGRPVDEHLFQIESCKD